MHVSMSETRDLRGRSAAVVFSSRFGNTEKIAKSFESGLRRSGMQTLCVNAQAISPDSLRGYDLICVGGPTEAFSASKLMKEFLKSTGQVDLEGKFSFAFDTKLDSPFSGSAAKYIEHALDDQGLHVVMARQSAIVTVQRQKGGVTGAALKMGEEERFQGLGLRVGTAATEVMTRIFRVP